MCGIAGFVGGAVAPDARRVVVQRMIDVLAHRGPDEEGCVLDGDAALGHRRLAIIDLSGGRQPIRGCNEHLWITFNGEIYNHRELRQELEADGHQFRTNTDTEAILHLYEKLGVDCLQRLNGMFAFAIWDGLAQTLFLARDRMGQKPLYYRELSGGIAFASETKALFEHPDITPELSPAGLDLYLTFEYVPAPRTIYRGVRQLEPGCALTYRDGSISVERYWTPDILDAAGPGPAPGASDDAVWDILDDAVRLRMLQADVPIGVLLSGGLDSSLITALAQRDRPTPIKTFSIGIDDPAYDESPFSTLVAESVGTEHYHRTFTAGEVLEMIPTVVAGVDEPFADASVLPATLLSRFAREQVTVCLTGDGSDELLGGYQTFVADPWAPVYASIPRPLRALVRRAADALPVSDAYFGLDFKAQQFLRGAERDVARRFTGWLGSFLPDEKQQLLGRSGMPAADDPAVALAGRLLGDSGLCDPIIQMLHLYTVLYLPNDILYKSDQASMINSLELRAPFLDWRVVAQLQQLPLRDKLRGRSTKRVLRRIAAGLVPRPVIERSKQGFGIPIARWLMDELRPLLDEWLSPEALKETGVFDPSVVRRLVDDHLQRRRNNRKQLWTLLAFQIWHRRWLTGK